MSELFAGYGPISSFSARIAFGYALGAYTKDARSDLTQIRQIRNEAAHRLTSFSFTYELIAARCKKLILTDTVVGDSQLLTHSSAERVSLLKSNTTRARFTRSTLALILMMQMAALDWVVKHLLNQDMNLEESYRLLNERHKDKPGNDPIGGISLEASKLIDLSKLFGISQSSRGKSH
jgi:DNA-binding MltR family transcriptional regulator